MSSLEDIEVQRVDNVSIPSSTGWSNETVFFDATWREREHPRQERLVARIAPSDYRVFPDDTFHLQYTAMRLLAERSDVPMPVIHWFESDPRWFGQPFWIMEYIDGDIAADTPHYAGEGWLKDAPPECRTDAWWSGIDAMAAIHRLDTHTLGFPAGMLDPPPDPLASVLDHYRDFLAWAEDGRGHGSARAALEWLRANRPAEPEQGPALVWGDARLSNVVYRDFEVVAVLDWEMCRIGDPLLDVGWWIFADDALTRGSGHERLPGFPSAPETADRWSARTGRSVEALDYYLLLGGLRLTVIMVRMGKLLHEMGLVPEAFAYDNLISQAMEELLPA
jgi:aminoglycoside phosphotransferase (APT) family kinase protein